MEYIDILEKNFSEKISERLLDMQKFDLKKQHFVLFIILLPHPQEPLHSNFVLFPEEMAKKFGES